MRQETSSQVPGAVPTLTKRDLESDQDVVRGAVITRFLRKRSEFSRNWGFQKKILFSFPE